MSAASDRSRVRPSAPARSSEHSGGSSQDGVEATPRQGWLTPGSGQPSAALAELVHDQFRALVLSPGFSCLGAKAAVRGGDFRLGVYDELGSARATVALARDLAHFALGRDERADELATFVASFTGPVAIGEAEFERRLWAQLQALHEADPSRAWDPSVSADPDDPHFSFSFAGRGFFVVGLHAASARWARRFAWPTLVFNPHAQFERLREEGRFDRFQGLIQARERTLQGSLNANLSDFGERSEARQYSGRPVEDDWRCPFRARATVDAPIEHGDSEHDGTVPAPAVAMSGAATSAGTTVTGRGS